MHKNAKTHALETGIGAGLASISVSFFFPFLQLN